MTCIVGLEHDNAVLIGADSSSVGGSDIQTTRIPKVFRNGVFVMGYTTSFRMGQLLQYVAKFPTAEEYDMAYMVKLFVPEVRTVFKENGYMTIKDNCEIGGMFLVGVNGQLYYIGSDFQVNSPACGFDAVGSGTQYALGNLLATTHWENPRIRVDTALLAAAHFDTSVTGPMRILGTDKANESEVAKCSNGKRSQNRKIEKVAIYYVIDYASGIFCYRC